MDMTLLTSRRVYAVLGLTLAWTTLPASAGGPAPDTFTTVVSSSHIVPGGTNNNGAVGCFRYNPVDGKIYIGIAGTNRALRVFDPATDTHDEYVDKDTLNGFAKATNIPGGLTNTNAGNSLPQGMLLNPVTIIRTWHNPWTDQDEEITYPPGTLAYVIDIGTKTPDLQYTKRMWRWDLRKAWTPNGDPTAVPPVAAIPPDYATAHNGNGVLVGARYQVDWNDIFTPVFSLKDMRTITGSTGTDNIGRQFAWSTNGSFIYFVDKNAGSSQGGLWKVDVLTGALQRVWSAPDPATENPIAEPGLVHTSVRDLTRGTYTGDQVIVDGLAGDGTNDGAGNDGGLDFFVDDGTIHGPFVLFDKAKFLRTIETTGPANARVQDDAGNDPGVNKAISPRVYSVVVDGDGVVYFYDSGGGQNLWRYDLQGRLIGIKSKIQQQMYTLSLDGTGRGAISMRLQLRSATYNSFAVRQLLFMASTTSNIAGLYLFKPGDFDRDNDFDSQDVSQFLAALQNPVETVKVLDTDANSGTYGKWLCYETVTNGLDQELKTTDPAAYVEYLKYDLNNNGLVNGKDKQIFWRLRGLSIADFDGDGDVDAADLLHIQQAVGKNTTWTRVPHILGDVDGDATVTLQDLQAFSECSTGPGITYANLGLPATCTLTPDDQGFVSADVDRDGDVDQVDFGAIQAGVGTVPSLTYTNALYGDADLNGDGSVDQQDLDLFTGCVSGDGVPANPDCPS
jgi:Ca2+-binding EF-hand superfamily protein